MTRASTLRPNTGSLGRFACTVRPRGVLALLHGELLAEAASMALAEGMPDARMRRAYRTQAEDEARHAELLRAYLGRLGAEPISRPIVPEFAAYERVMTRAVERGCLLTLVLGTNVALEALACVGLAASARWVEAADGDPAWVALMAQIEADERRHTRLASPALHALGGGAIPAQARETLVEIREAAIASLDGFGPDLTYWGVDPEVLFDAALREVHPALAGALFAR